MSQKLTVEMFKVSRGLSPEIINELFQFREKIPYELRQRPQFQIPWVHSFFSGTESLKYFELESLGKLWNAIKLWKPASCPCRLCIRYFQRIGFL